MSSVAGAENCFCWNNYLKDGDSGANGKMVLVSLPEGLCCEKDFTGSVLLVINITGRVLPVDYLKYAAQVNSGNILMLELLEAFFWQKC